jgi:hypothetical protein
LWVRIETTLRCFHDMLVLPTRDAALFARGALMLDDARLIEAIMTVRNLTNGRTWTPRDIEQALSSHALTTVMMARFHIVEKVKRSLGSELSRPSRAA